MAGVGNPLSGAAGQIGRYFSVLTVLPSAVLVTYVYLLVSSDAWTGRPDWSAAAKSFSGPELGLIAQLAFLSLLVGLVLHPLQYALVQFLEGYWGTSALAVRAMACRARHHRARRTRLYDLGEDAISELEACGQHPRKSLVKEPNLDHLMRMGEAARLFEQYPKRPNDIRPTRLGNVLRRHESEAGSQYGLSAVTAIPYVALVGAQNDVAYLDDQRTGLDLAVRLVVISALATFASVLFLWRAGPWLLLSLGPYSLVYAFYRGAVVVAAEYGVAMNVLIDLNRFALYERLGLRRPGSIRAEREQNRETMKLLRADKGADVRYAPVKPPPATTP